MRNRIRIGFTLNNSGGGPHVFMNNLREELRKYPGVSISYFFDPLVSFNIYASKPRLIGYKPFFFRVDGVAFNSEMPPEQKKKTNNNLLDGIRFAKGVIFQSEFCKRQTESILGVSPSNNATILNGTNLKLFSKHGQNVRKDLGIEEDSIVFITSAKWRAHKRLASIIKVFNEVSYSISHKSYLLIVGEPDIVVEKRPDIICLGRVTHENLPKTLRAGDIFLFLSWLDHCPNSVVEAIACGLPVVCSNQGGTKEIVYSTNGGMVVDADDDFNHTEIALYKPPEPNIEKLVMACKDVLKSLESYKSRICTDMIDIQNVARLYYNFLTDNENNLK